MPTQHKVSVTVDRSSIQVVPETLTMTSEDEVHWVGTNAKKFSIVFDGVGPFGQSELGHSVATTGQRPKRRGHFKYTVVSEEDPSLRLDPVVVVEDPPTGQDP